MADKKSAQYPYKWPDGTWHSIPYAQHTENLAKVQRTPWQPPPGTYDPGLDMQERNALTGAAQTGEDIATTRRRSGEDYTYSASEIARQRAEYEQDYQGSLSDLLRSRTQGQEDYQTNLQTLGRNYQRLGNTQMQQQRKMGLYGGGAAQQGAEKRAGNQAIEKTALDTGLNRFLEGSQIAEQRLNQQRERALGAEGGFARQAGELERDYTRGAADLTRTEERAGTSLQDYLQDLSTTRQAQARTYIGGQIIKKPKKKKKAA